MCGWRRRDLHRRIGVALGDELDVEDEVGLCGDHRRPAERSVSQLVGNEEAALATHVHAFEALIPSGDYALGALHEVKWRAAIDRRVEFCSVRRQPSGVVHGVDLVGSGEIARADLDLLVPHANSTLMGPVTAGMFFGNAGCAGCAGLGRAAV